MGWSLPSEALRGMVKADRLFVDAGVERVLVDGMNLFLRCHHAAMGELLQDARGRTTGALFGFLRALGAYRRRFPRAELWVAWEGSDARRKAVCPAYKSTRGARVAALGWDQLVWLHDALSSCGVMQAHCPQGEADDAIATLVKSVEKQALIVSTDRDFLQLLDSRTRLLVAPARLGKEERILDAASVRREWLVEVRDILVLRAFMGDTSDDLPGVARVSMKFMAGLVREHRTLSAIYKLDMRKWTKTRRANLLAHRDQAYMNFRLMELGRYEVLEVLKGDRDEAAFVRRLEEVSIQPGPLVSALLGEARVARVEAQVSLFV
jgi:DNA polymerase-1